MKKAPSKLDPRVSGARAILAQELRFGLIHDLDADPKLASLTAGLESAAEKTAPWLLLEQAPLRWREDPAFVKMFTFDRSVTTIAVAGPKAPPERRNWLLVGRDSGVILLLDMNARRELR